MNRERAATPTDDHAYRIDLARWWQLVEQHLAHPSADLRVVNLEPGRELLLRSGWDWAGVKSVLDQVMAVTTTQLLEELRAAPSDEAAVDAGETRAPKLTADDA